MERREYVMSPDKTSRLWTKAGLQVPRKRPRKQVTGSIPSDRGIEMLARLVSEHGVPRHLHSNNGPEFVSHALLRCMAKENLSAPRQALAERHGGEL